MHAIKHELSVFYNVVIAAQGAWLQPFDVLTARIARRVEGELSESESK